MDFVYHNQNCRVEVYVGRLSEDVPLVEEENPLYWSPLTENYFDHTKYAGEGNIGHMLLQVELFGKGVSE